MKSGIHPQIHDDAVITCATCGEVFNIPCAEKEVSIETCSKCHPVYTGKEQKEVKGGRIERFRKRMAAGQQKGE